MAYLLPTYLLQHPPSPSPTMLYMPRKAIHTNHEIGRTDIASGTMGVNFTVGRSDGDIIHAQVDASYPPPWSRVIYSTRACFSRLGSFHDGIPSPHQPGQLPKFCLRHLMLRQKVRLSLPGFLARCLVHKSSLVLVFCRRSPCLPNASLPP
jgi:hypothetical protein